MAIMILIGNLRAEGDASEHLIKLLSGLELPLAGIAPLPYLPGQEISEGYESLLGSDGICYLVNKIDLMQALAEICPRACAEIQLKYMRLDYLPFKKESCKIITQCSQGTVH